MSASSFPRRWGLRLVLGAAFLAALLAISVRINPEVLTLLVGERFTDQQRAEMIRTEFARIYPEDAALLNSSPTRLRVRGRISGTGNDPLPRVVQVHHFTTRGSSAESADLKPINPQESLEFDFDLPPGSSWIEFQATGFKPVVLGPLGLSPNGQIQNLEVVLQTGATIPLRIVDPEGQPIAGAEVTALPRVARGTAFGRSAVHGNDRGEVLLEGIDVERELSLTIAAPGHQQRQIPERRFAAGEPVEIPLQRARAVTGQVVDQSGQPIPGATISLTLTLFPPHSASSSGSFPGKKLAQTDSQGGFVLDALADRSLYNLTATAPGYGPQTIPSLAPGTKDVLFTLPAEWIVRGTIQGSAADLKQLKSIPWNVSRDIQISKDNFTSQQIPWEIQEGEGRFEVRGLSRGPFRMSVMGTQVEQELTQPETVITFPFVLPPSVVAAPDNTPEERQVTVSLVRARDQKPIILGGALVVFADGSKSLHGESSLLIPLNGAGPVSFPVRIPETIRFWDEHLLGGKFSVNSPLPVGSGPGPAQAFIQVEPTGAVTGVVRHADGSPAGGALMKINYRHRQSLIDQWTRGSRGTGGDSTRANERGEFLFKQIPLGVRFEVTAELSAQSVSSSSQRLTSREPMPRVELRFPAASDLTIRILDEQGAPLPGHPYRLNRSSTSSDRRFQTDARGESTFRVNPDERDSQMLIIPGINGYQPVRRPISPGSVIEVRLPRGYVIRGQLIDAQGQPVALAEVRGQFINSVHGTEGPITADAPTNQQGEFQFTSLPPGVPVHLWHHKENTVNNVNSVFPGVLPAPSLEEAEIIEITPFP